MTKVVFICYSHDSEEHKAWVKKFADDLSMLGDFEILLDQNMPKGYPFKLEFGQQFTASYKIDSQNAKMFLRLLAEDPSLTIKAIVNTTIGEIVESEPYSLNRLSMHLERLIQN